MLELCFISFHCTSFWALCFHIFQIWPIINGFYTCMVLISFGRINCSWCELILTNKSNDCFFLCMWFVTQLQKSSKTPKKHFKGHLDPCMSSCYFEPGIVSTVQLTKKLKTFLNLFLKYATWSMSYYLVKWNTEWSSSCWKSL